MTTPNTGGMKAALTQLHKASKKSFDYLDYALQPDTEIPQRMFYVQASIATSMLAYLEYLGNSTISALGMIDDMVKTDE